MVRADIERAVLAGARSLRWWPFKTSDVEVKLERHVSYGDVGLIILRVGNRALQFPYALVRSVREEIASRSIPVEGGYLVEAPYTTKYFDLIDRLIEDGVISRTTRPERRLVSVNSKPLAVDTTNPIGVHELEGGARVVVKSYALISSSNVEPLAIIRLSERGFENIPRLVAAYRLSEEFLELEGPAYLSIVTELIEGEGDAGRPLALNLKSLMLSKAALKGKESEPLDVEGSFSGKLVEELLVNVGRAVADMHYLLNAGESDDFFGLEIVTTRDVDLWIERIDQHSKSIHALLGDAISKSEPRRRPYYELAAELFEKIYEKVGERAVAHLDEYIDAYKGRAHGDLHFLQMIHRGTSVYITDFEGEPLRADRARTKEPLVRDVATLCSGLGYMWFFQYLDVVSELGRSSGAAGLDADSRILSLGSSLLRGSSELLLRDWVIDKSRVLALSYGYRVKQIAEERGVDLHGFRRGPFHERYSLYLLPWIYERALYEMKYELSYRPPYSIVPLLLLYYPPVESASSGADRP